MSEEIKLRTLEDVQKEYQPLCLAAGDLQYRIYAMSDELREVDQKMKALNQEAFQINEATKKLAEEKKDGAA